MVKFPFRYHLIPELSLTLIRLSYQMHIPVFSNMVVFNHCLLETKKFHSRSHKLFSLRPELDKGCNMYDIDIKIRCKVGTGIKKKLKVSGCSGALERSVHVSR